MSWIEKQKVSIVQTYHVMIRERSKLVPIIYRFDFIYIIKSIKYNELAKIILRTNIFGEQF